MTADLVQFLRARLDEDEQTAKALCNDTRPGRIPQWEHCDDSAIRDAAPRDPVLRVRFTWAPEAAHIVRHGPARVLAEVDAKRQVVERFEQAQRYASTAWGQSNAALAEAQALRAVALLLASAHADHPDYREEWKP